MASNYVPSGLNKPGIAALPAAPNPTPAETSPRLPSGAADKAGLDSGDTAAINALFKQMEPQTTQADYARAMAPTMQAQQQGLPASMTRPITPFQPTPLNQQPVVGAGNARARGIGNAITGAMNAVGSFVNARAQTLQDQHAQSVSRFLQAQYGADQARQIQKGDPGYEEAQKTIAQNEALQKKMLEDPKFAKVLEKGMNISLTDPSKNKTPEHQSFMQGMLHFRKQQAQAGQTPPNTAQMLQRFGEQMPKQLAPNQMAIQQLQMKLQQDAAKLAVGKEMREYMQKKMEVEGRVDVAKLSAFKEFSIANFNAQKEDYQRQMRAQDAEKLENLRKDNDLWLERSKQALDLSNPMKAFQFVDDSVKQLTDFSSKLNTDKIADQKELDTLLKDPKKNQGRIQEVRNEMDQIDRSQKATKSLYDMRSNFAKSQWGLNIPEFPAPPSVGAGEKVPAASSEDKDVEFDPASVTDPNLNPFTNKPWDPGLSEPERLAIVIGARLPRVGGAGREGKEPRGVGVGQPLLP